MSPERSPSTPATFEDLYRAYAAELPKWLHRYRLSAQDLEDVVQEVWLVVSANPERIPTNPTDARRELRRIALNIARTMQRRAMRDAERHNPALPTDELRGQITPVEQLDNMSELMDAIDQLDTVNRELFIANKILERPLPEIAAMTGLGEDAIWLRVWNACAKIRKALARNQKRDERRGVLIAPAEIEIAPETRAAMCALWSLEGRMPIFGGPKDPPPPLPPIPWFANAYPAVSQAARGIALKVNQTILLLLLVLTSAGTVALIWFWQPMHVDTAHSGLRVPQTYVGEINDVVDAYPTQAPAAPSARASVPTAKHKPSPALDDDALQELEGPGLTPVGSGSE